MSTDKEEALTGGNGEGQRSSINVDGGKLIRPGERVQSEHAANIWSPAVESVDIRAIFGEVTEQPSWVSWTYERNEDGDWKKPPIDPTTKRKASVDKPNTWGTLAKVRKLGGNIGLVLSKALEIVALDVDGVRNCVTGEVPSKFVREFIEKADTYTEVSPSGTGFRLLWRCPYGQFPGGKRNLTGQTREFGFKLPDGSMHVHKAEIELFSHKNAYVTITGQHLVGTPLTIHEAVSNCLQVSEWVAADQGKKNGATETIKTTQDEVRAALKHVPGDNYQRGKGEPSWLLVGMALHNGERHGELPDGDGFELWKEWSRRFRTDCTDVTFNEKWRSFNDKGDSSVTLRSIFHWALGQGWQPPKTKGKRNGHDREEDQSYAFNIINAASVKPKHREWLWPGRIPMGALALLVGLPGEGKSHVYVDIAARYTTGQVMPNGEDEAVVFKLPPGRVVIFCTEDDIERTLVPRLMAAGADMTKVDFIQYLRNEKGEERGLDITQDVPRLAAYLKQHDDARLVVFDPISENLGTRVDSHNNTSVRAACGQLVRMLGEHNIAGIGVSHLPKTKSGSIKTAAIGSIAFSALARAILWVTDELDSTTDPVTGGSQTEPTGRKLLFLSKANLAPDDRCKPLAFTLESHDLPMPGDPLPLQTSRAQWDGEVEATSTNYWTGGSGGGEGGKPKAIDEAAKFIREMMLNKEKSTRDKPVFCERLADEMKAEAELRNISGATLRRAYRRLGITPYKREGDGKFMWDIPALWLVQQGEIPF